MSSSPNTTETATNANAAQTVVRGAWLALSGLAVCLIGCFSYIALIGNAFLRATGAFGFGLLIVGIVLGWIAVRRDRRRWLKVTLGLDLFLLCLYTFGLFWLTALPSTPEFETLALAPDFTLSNQAGQTMKLSEAYVAGPVLLVFYRGFW